MKKGKTGGLKPSHKTKTRSQNKKIEMNFQTMVDAQEGQLEKLTKMITAEIDEEKKNLQLISEMTPENGESDKLVSVRPLYPKEGVFDFEKTEDNFKEYLIPTNRPVRIYCDGVYDMFHYGHARYLQQAKNLFKNVHLIAGVSNDKETRELKGDTVFNELERAESLRHCRYVDEVVEAPWIITKDFLDQHKIDYVCHDTHSDLYKGVEELGKFIPTKRTLGISTTKIITRIIRDYDDFVRRNFERGVSEKDLNLGFLKKSQFRMIRKKREIQQEIKEEFDGLKAEILIALKFWERKRNEFFAKFMQKFKSNISKIRNLYAKATGSDD